MKFDFVKFFEEQDIRQLGYTQRKVRMTKGEAVSMFNTINAMVYMTGARFTYAIAKNMNSLKEEVQALAKILEQDDEMKAFEEKRIELAKKHAKKDEKTGNPISVKNNYVLLDEAAFEKEYQQLREENKEVVEKYDKQVAEYSELLKEDCDIKLHKVRLEDVPAEVNAMQMTAIMHMIVEPEEVK